MEMPRIAGPRSCSRRLRLAAGLACVCLAAGCASNNAPLVAVFPPPPEYPPEHAYTLDELTELAIYRNASLDVARYEAEAVQGLVDQVKALWLPAVRISLAGFVYDNNLDYDANVFNLTSLNIPLSGNYNFLSAASFVQILSTGGKRTSGLKQARMFAAIKKLEVLRLQDAVAFDVANYYHLVCLTSEIDDALEDAVRRLRVFRQVAESLTARGSLRASRLDALQADYFLSQLEQFQLFVRAGRHQAYHALRHYVGMDREQPLILKSVELPPAVTLDELVSRAAQLVKGFLARPELRQLDLFTKIRGEQVTFAKAQWAPNVVLAGGYTDVQGDEHSILGAIDGLIISLLVDIPIYDPARRGKLREALGLEQASLAFQREIEDLIALEIEVTAVDAQRALAAALKTARALQTAAEHYTATRQAYTRELLPAAAVVTAIGLDLLAKIQDAQARFAYQNARARLKRVTADREAQFGY